MFDSPTSRLANLLGRYLVSRGNENLPAWDGRRSHYEVWFLTFNVPSERAAFWLRYTLDSPDHGEPYAELWGHFFDGANPDRRFGLRRRVPASDFSVGGSALIRIGDASLREGGLRGELEGGGHRLRWDLSFESSPTAFFIAPTVLRPFLSRKRTNWCSPNIDVRFRGRIEADGRVFELEGAPGQQGHLFGRQHAERWVWCHCNTFDGGREALFEAVSALLALPGGIRRLNTAIYVRYQGRDYLCNAFPRPLWSKGELDFPEWRFGTRSGDTELVGRARVSPELMLQVRYEDPDGTQLWCCNSELADLTVEVRRGGRTVDVLTATSTANLEFAGRERRPEVRLALE